MSGNRVGEVTGEITFRRDGQPRYRIFVTQEIIGEPRANNETRRFEQVILKTLYHEYGNGAWGKRGVTRLLTEAREEVAKLNLEGYHCTVAIHEWDSRYGTWPKIIALSEVED